MIILIYFSLFDNSIQNDWNDDQVRHTPYFAVFHDFSRAIFEHLYLSYEYDLNSKKFTVKK